MNQFAPLLLGQRKIPRLLELGLKFHKPGKRPSENAAAFIAEQGDVKIQDPLCRRGLFIADHKQPPAPGPCVSIQAKPEAGVAGHHNVEGAEQGEIAIETFAFGRDRITAH